MAEWHEHAIWVSIGLGGQALFFMRFFVQWVASEREGRSVVPEVFWYFSLGGGVTLLAYAIWRRDPVFVIGQATGLFIYSRNIYLLSREKRRKRAGLGAQDAGEARPQSV